MTEHTDVKQLKQKRRQLQKSYEETKKLKLAGYSGLRKRLHNFRVEVRKRIISLNHRIRHLQQHGKLGDAIDVSYAQPHVEWVKVGGGGILVGFRKITEGATFDDPAANKGEFDEMERNVRAGLYHFCRPDNNSAAAEVAHIARRANALGLKVISYANWRADKEGVVVLVDFETAPYNQTWLIAFAKELRRVFDIGWGAVLYGGGYSLDPVLGAIKYFAGVLIAGYPNFSWDGPDSVIIWHQFTDEASVPGVPGAVDRSKYLKSS